jgi:hypothetical protein
VIKNTAVKKYIVKQFEIYKLLFNYLFILKTIIINNNISKINIVFTLIYEFEKKKKLHNNQQYCAELIRLVEFENILN